MHIVPNGNESDGGCQGACWSHLHRIAGMMQYFVSGGGENCGFA